MRRNGSMGGKKKAPTSGDAPTKLTSKEQRSIGEECPNKYEQIRQEMMAE